MGRALGLELSWLDPRSAADTLVTLEKSVSLVLSFACAHGSK